MADFLYARYYAAGGPIGNTLQVSITPDGVTRTVAIVGDPGLTPAQLDAAKLVIWCTDDGASNDIFIITQVSPPVETYADNGRGRVSRNRLMGGCR